MAWDSGSITSASPWAAFSTKLKAVVGTSGVANWSFMENIPAGTGTGQSGASGFSVDVFKCATSGTNGHGYGTDWYFGLGIPVPDGAVSTSILVAETYKDIAGNPADADRGKFKRPVACGNGTALTSAPTGASYWLSDAYGTFTSYATGGIRILSQTLNTSGFPYYIKLTNQMLLFYASATANGASLTGAALLDSVVTNVTDDLPLIGWGTDLCGQSRLPGVSASAVSNQWRLRTKPWNGVLAGSDGGTNAVNTNDLWQSNGIWASRVHFVSGATSANYYQVGGVRGLLPGDVICFQQGGTVNTGDTFTLDGNTWTVLSPSIGAVSPGMYYAVRAV